MSIQETIPGPCHFVIFGATGNLATIKLLPCLYNLEAAGRITGDMSILALGRQEHTQESWLEHLSKVLHDKFGIAFEEAYTAYEAKADRGEDESDEANQLLKHAAKLDAEEQQAEAEFAATRQHLEDHHLPDEIKQRHAEALAGYRAKMKQLKQLVQGFKAAHGRKDKAAARQHLKDMADFLSKEQKHRKQQPFDPNNLPNATLKPKPGNVPKETPKAFIQAGLTDRPPIGGFGRLYV